MTTALGCMNCYLLGFFYHRCYICLVEYDEGDFMRVLPCHHDFHQTCIDKWLKEIHRYYLDFLQHIFSAVSTFLSFPLMYCCTVTV